MSETKVVDIQDDTMEVPVLELDFNKFLEISQKINLVDSITLFSMPNHLKSYSDRNIVSVGDLIMELIEYQKEENKWRLEEFKVEQFSIENNSIKVINRTISDAYRIIIVSKMNSVFIIPGEESIKKGNCQANQIIKLSNLISSQLFLLVFNDVKSEETGNYDLKAEFALIDRTKIKENNDN